MMDNTTAPEEKEVKTGGFKVDTIVLIESNFKRVVTSDFKNVEVKNQISFDSEAHETTPTNKFGVTLNLNFEGMQEDLSVCTAKISMLGIFEKFGEPALTEDAFKKINAPAIIYPFIREHLHNICLKAGINNVFLPTVNFKP